MDEPAQAPSGSVGDVPGVRVGHAQRVGEGWLTGVTVVLPPPGTVGGVDVRGGGPGTHETDALDPRTLVPTVDAVVLTGGSAFGLVAAHGAQRWLAEQGRGFPVSDVPGEVVPIVPAAAALGSAAGGDGYAACEAASDEAVDALAVVGETAAGLVVVDADLTQAECRRVAMSAHDGFARAGVEVPATVFAVATGVSTGAALNDLCTRAAEALERVVRES